MGKDIPRQEWEARVATFRACGQGVTEWCRVTDVKALRIYYWLKEFRGEGCETSSTASPQWLSWRLMMRTRPRVGCGSG